ncbi:MAG: hypothetical protein LBJ00_14325 [Planctomycetaceae bacterium]|nr:hypothetical protein [Planctomycetaceae bacterium]
MLAYFRYWEVSHRHSPIATLGVGEKFFWAMSYTEASPYRLRYNIIFWRKIFSCVSFWADYCLASRDR